MDKLLRIRELMASWFLIKTLSIDHFLDSTQKKNMMKRTHVCNLEIRIEETSLWKARTVIKENVKIANNNIKWGSWTCVVTYWFEKIMDVSTFVLYFQFEIFCRSWFKFLIGNFIVVLIRNFLPDWEPEILKQLGPHRYFSGNWWNWWENKSIFTGGIFSIESNLLRKRKANHILVKPSSRFYFHKPSLCQL